MMTLDEAIKHSEGVAERYEYLLETDNEGWGFNGSSDNCKKCAENHRQLSRWLKELKVFREEIDGMSDEDEIFVGYLRHKISEI